MKTKLGEDLEGCARMQKDLEGVEEHAGLRWLPPSFNRSFIRVGPGEHDFGPVFSSKWLGWTKGASWCVFS